MDDERTVLLKYIDSKIINSRYDEIDTDYLDYECKMSSIEDLENIKYLLNHGIRSLENPHNSILLYITGISDIFDKDKGRSNMIEGSPPDIDLDFSALDREKAVDWCIDYWGRDNVANIITHGTFKPKSLARSFYRITEGPQEDLNELLSKIPPPKYGKEATLEEILDLNPDLKEDPKYQDFLLFADRIEDVIANFGIHAAGVIISDFPIHDVIPMWKNAKAERITQFDKDECEELGALKFDFLGIDTLSIIKDCCRLVKENKNIDINPYSIEDGDKKTYEAICNGHLTGVFQMETSGTAKRLIIDSKPNSIEDLSAISALNRPGPLQAGFDKQYIKNKKTNMVPEDLPQSLADILEPSYWTLLYQEQVMQICSDLAGFTPKESDDIRRAMGKKKISVLEKYKVQFIEGCQNIGGLAKDYAEKLWDDLLGFADYCLHADTIIICIEDGVFKHLSISDIVYHRKKVKLFTYDWEADEFIITEPIQFHERVSKDIFKYTLSNGESITCTPDHKFLTLDKKMLEIEQIFQLNKELYTTGEL